MLLLVQRQFIDAIKHPYLQLLHYRSSKFTATFFLSSFIGVTCDYIIPTDQMKKPELLNGKFGLKSCGSAGKANGEFVVEAVVEIIPDRFESS